MSKSKILWTEETWNPVTGCTKISKGCANCYAYDMTKRLKAMGQPKYQQGFDVVVHPDCLSIPLKKRIPTVYFVNSMSDLFHDEVPAEFIGQVFDVMNKCPQHTFQVLTKRSERMMNLAPNLTWTGNIYMGVTVESDDYYERIDHLRSTPAKIKFLSLEPLLSDISGINLEGIDWAIVAGESGPKARPMPAEWVRPVRDRCIEMGIPFFFKQWGGKGKAKKERGRVLDGKIWEEMPFQG